VKTGQRGAISVVSAAVALALVAILDRKTHGAGDAKGRRASVLSPALRMNMLSPAVTERSVLLVADAPGAAASLAAAVREYRDARFTLLVPAVAHGLHRVVDPEDQCCAEAERTIGILRPGIEAAGHGPIVTVTGSHEPLAAIEDALNLGDFDEIVLAIRSSRLAQGIHLDLARKVRALGVPVTTAGHIVRRHQHAA